MSSKYKATKNTTESLRSQRKYMKQILIITFAFLLFTTPLFAQVQESGVLYLWEISEEKIWKSFGDDETQQKYKGEIKDGKVERFFVYAATPPAREEAAAQ